MIRADNEVKNALKRQMSRTDIALSATARRLRQAGELAQEISRTAERCYDIYREIQIQNQSMAVCATAFSGPAGILAAIQRLLGDFPGSPGDDSQWDNLVENGVRYHLGRIRQAQAVPPDMLSLAQYTRNLASSPPAETKWAAEYRRIQKDVYRLRQAALSAPQSRNGFHLLKEELAGKEVELGKAADALRDAVGELNRELRRLRQIEAGLQSECARIRENAVFSQHTALYRLLEDEALTWDRSSIPRIREAVEASSEYRYCRWEDAPEPDRDSLFAVGAGDAVYPALLHRNSLVLPGKVSPDSGDESKPTD